jgi:hypothetical protein
MDAIQDAKDAGLDAKNAKNARQDAMDAISLANYLEPIRPTFRSGP